MSILTSRDAWPLTSLRQSFLDGSLTRLIDPETILRRQITEFVSNGEFGLAVWSKYSNAQRISSLHVSRIDADIEDREAA